MKSITTSTKDRFNRSYTIKPSGCWEWDLYKVTKGYGQFWNGTKMQLAHRYSYELANGRIDLTKQICHKCDNPCCVNPSHLFEGTHQDNTDDKLNKGRQPRGVLCVQAKLSEKDVINILHAAKQGVRQNALAKQYRVGTSAIHGIIHNKKWKHIPRL